MLSESFSVIVVALRWEREDPIALIGSGSSAIGEQIYSVDWSVS